MRALHLEPARAAPARFVERIERLRHDALVAAREGVGIERRRPRLVGGHYARDEVFLQNRSLKGLTPIDACLVDERLALAQPAVEEKHRQRQLAAHFPHVQLAAEAPHRHLEGMGLAVRAQGDRLAVEDQRAHREPAHRRNDLGNRGSDVVQIAREDAHLTAGFMHLHTRAIELPFEDRGAKRSQRRLHVLSGLREHRQHRLHQPDRKTFERGRAASERGLGDLRDATGEGRRAPHLRRGQPGRSRERLDHDAFQRALAELADEQAREEILLLRSRAFEQFGEPLFAPCRGALALDGSQLVEGPIDLEQRQGRSRRRRGARRLQARITERQLPLPDLAAQVRDCDADFVRLETPEAIGQLAHLGEPAGRAGNLGRRAHHVGKQRHATFSAGCPCRRERMPWSLSRSCRRSTIMSIAPFSNRNSARWKPSGSFCRTVCSITRGPAKPISALGSAITTSPIIAKLAETPPIVGSVSTDTNGSLRSARSVRAAVVLAICTSESSPSCMRAPPDAVTQTNGSFCSIATRTPRTKRSPTTDPIEPPIKSNSNAAHTTPSALIAPCMTTSASLSAVCSCASASLSVLRRESLNLSVSTGSTSAPISKSP